MKTHLPCLLKLPVMSIEGKVAIVTGASSGIGKSLAIKYGCCCNAIFIDIAKAKQIKIIIKISPEILLAKRDPNSEPDIIPAIHFFTI